MDLPPSPRRSTLDALVNYAYCQGRAARWYDAHGSDRLLEIEELAIAVRGEYRNSVLFATRLVFEKDRWWTRWLHSQTPLAIQRALNALGMELVLLAVTLRAPTAPSRPPGAAATIGGQS